MGNILNNNVRSIKTLLYNDKYYDFMLYRGKVESTDNIEDYVVSDFTYPFNFEDDTLYSSVIWDGAVCDEVELNDIGFTGPDNGLITFRKDRISNKDYLDILTGSTYKIDDTRLFLTPVSGNTLNFSYPIEKNEDYIAFKGGFYQGFYKLYNYEYQTLPNSVDSEWNLYFELKPRSDYEIGIDTINHIHPENKGIFFYMGTRAENKFWHSYRMDEDIVEGFKRIPDDNNYTNPEECLEIGDTDFQYNNVTHEEFLKDEEPEKKEEYFIDDYTVSASTPDCPCAAEVLAKEENKHDNYYFMNDEYSIDDDYLIDMGERDCQGHIAPGGDLTPYCKKHSTICSGDSGRKSSGPSWYSISDFFDYKYNENSDCRGSNSCSCGEKKVNGQSCCCNVDNNYKEECECDKSFFGDEYYNQECGKGEKAIDTDYVEKDIDFTEEQIQDSEGHEYTKKGYFEIETDNKFILFDRTKDGFDVNNWIEGTKVILTGRSDLVSDANLFTVLDRTKTGHTVNDLQEYKEANTKYYNVFNDIKNNAFALKINEDGSIGYRYCIFDCDAENRYSIAEEYSKPNIIKANDWNKINVKITAMDSKLMKIYIYVDGYLIFVSKELPKLNFKALNDIYQKQETVPYNISLGGGTQGLLESIVPDYYNSLGEKYILPIEKDFCGSFIGDIKSFKFIEGAVNYQTLKNFIEKSK